jgi:hypothetical protein
MRYYLTILGLVLGLILTFSLSAQTKYNPDLISKSTNKVVKKIGKVNKLMGNAVYYAGIRPAQYDNFEKLKKTASKEELLELMNHSNGVVRCYSFWALSYNKTVDLFPILINHIEDYELVNTQFGCIGSQRMVGDFLISVATPRYIDTETKKLDSIQFSKLDSILIHSNSKLYAKSNAISRAKTTESNYEKIRELVVKNNTPSALVTLAKYNKQEDIPLILESRFEKGGFFYTYKAIQEFPSLDFIPLLEENLYKTLDKTHFSNEWRELYKAIASYKNEKSVELLKIPFTQVQPENIRKYHIDFVYTAIRMNKCEIYDTLLWKMWSEEKRISTDIYHYLMERDSLKAFELTKNSILYSKNGYSENIDLNFNELGSIENLTSIMLDEILKRDKEMGVEIICENIKNTNVHRFPIFNDKVIKLKDSAFIAPLFERFESEWNAHVYLKIAQALLVYKDKNINQRILALPTI